MKYQLVLQFRAITTQDFNDLVSLENLLIENLRITAEVDGHDFGSNEFNLFILTDQPEETFRRCERVFEQYHAQQQFKAAYRETGKDEFIALWPRTLKDFKIA